MTTYRCKDPQDAAFVPMCVRVAILKGICQVGVCFLDLLIICQQPPSVISVQQER